MANGITVSEEQLQQYFATAWATARVLGAAFSPQCFGNVEALIRQQAPVAPPLSDTSVVAATNRDALFHARVVRLVELMFEQAITPGPAQPVQPSDSHVVILHEWSLSGAIQSLKICLWPFWLDAC